MFAQRKRITVSNSITTQDIYGAQSGTLRKGLSSKRMTNPINPEYQHLGRSQMNLRQDHVYAEPWKEEVVPRKICREKPEWKKSTVIPVIEDKKVNVSVSIEHTNPFPTAANVFFTIIYQEALRGSMAKFYGVDTNDIKQKNLELFEDELKKQVKRTKTPTIAAE